MPTAKDDPPLDLSETNDPQPFILTRNGPLSLLRTRDTEDFISLYIYQAVCGCLCSSCMRISHPTAG